MSQSLKELCSQFGSDKIGYIDHYERHFGPFRNQPVRLLELGVHRGSSLLMWREYFPQGQIVGLDIGQYPLPEPYDRLAFVQGSQGDQALLQRLAEQHAPGGFDIIIDDAAHVGKLAQASFEVLAHRFLRSGGIYVIEDWGTGYWPSWPDGSSYSHAANAPRGSFSAGMVGFVKSIVDEVAWGDVTHPTLGDKTLPPRRPIIASLNIYQGIAFLARA